MKLYIGSLMFNLNTQEGGQPSWGTEMGQGEGYKFNFDDCGPFLSGMVYNSIKDIENVWCPLGKGGNRQEDYEYVIASLFKKVYINDTLIKDGQYILLIVKQIASDSNTHIGRRTLKYSPKIKYHDEEINDAFFKKARDQIGLTDEAAWFVEEIKIINQDELHFVSHICNKTHPIEFENADDRTTYVNAVLSKTSPSIFNRFQSWLTTYDNPDYSGTQKYEGYAYCLRRLIQLMHSKKYIDSDDLNSLEVSKYENIRDEYKNHQDIIDFDKTKNQSQAGIAALKKYILYIKFLKNLNDHPIVGFNKIYYGSPGCGKSYFVKNDLLPNTLKIRKDNIIRTTFYQDYSNTDFVGQILPKVSSDGDVTYEFNPGPFTLALAKAYKAETTPVALVIEEINRGSAASIFGDIFQLLDREENGESVFRITNVNIQNYLEKEFSIVKSEIYIPSNLFIIATMNTSDQNVFTLDSAFKRRWKFEKIKNDFKENTTTRGMLVPGMNDVAWEDIVMSINEYIIDNADQFMTEDKQIGIYFVDKNDLVEKKIDVVDEKKIKDFSYKLLEYLWDDVAKFSEKNKWFKNARTLDELLELYEKNGKKLEGESIFSDQLKLKIEETKKARLSKNSPQNTNNDQTSPNNN